LVFVKNKIDIFISDYLITIESEVIIMEKAEKIKESWHERRTKIKKGWHVPFIFLEWNCERLLYLLSRWAFIEILQYASQLAIILAVISYAKGCTQRKMQAENQRKAKHYQAWQVINAAQGKPGSGGRMDALQDLNKDGVSLAGVDISQAHLPKLNLENADLTDANLSGVNLADANLSGANLINANLSGANLARANLSESQLRFANLTRAGLSKANFSKANLWSTNLNEANLTGANLHGAAFVFANLTKAKLPGADLTKADLSNANLTGAILKGANLTKATLGSTNLKSIQYWQEIRNIKEATIFNIKEPPEGFIELAIKKGAVKLKDDEKTKKLLRDKVQEMLEQQARDSIEDQNKIK
jgi:uncharacterized protein YjbI with pentapeptide repeats